MNLKDVLQRVPDVNRRFIYYLESQGYIHPTRLQKERIARRDYREEDLRVIHETWRYYRQGFSLQTAYALGVTQERITCYVGFRVPLRAHEDALARLKEIPEVLEASVVYADNIDFFVKLSAPREVDLYHALAPVFAQVGVTGLPRMLRTEQSFSSESRGPEGRGEATMKAYVLIAVPGKGVSEVMDRLKELEGIVEASTVYGESDIVARADVPSQDALDLLVMEQIHSIPAVESTRTYIVIGGRSWQRQES